MGYLTLHYNDNANISIVQQIHSPFHSQKCSQFNIQQNNFELTMFSVKTTQMKASGNKRKNFAPNGDFKGATWVHVGLVFDGGVEPRSTVRYDRKVRSSGFCLGEPENQGTGSQWYQSDCAMLRMGVYPIRGVCLHP